MDEKQSRRNFLKYGFIGIAGFLTALVPIKFNSNESFTISDKIKPSLGLAEANAACGMGMSCSGGGGECGMGINCGGGGGGGQCGMGMSCSGGGGQCGMGMNCSGR